MSEVPRPDQRLIGGPGGAAGSRSGAGDLAGALGFPGIPAAVPNCAGATLTQKVGFGSIFQFPSAGRLWLVILSYVITSNGSFTVSTARTFASVRQTTPLLVLATIRLGVANPNQHDSNTVAVPYPGLPVVAGATIQLNVNGGTAVTNLDQEASVSMLYSIP